MDPFKEYLQELVDQKKPCTLRFRTVEGAVSEIRAHLTELITVAHRDMIGTDAGIHIGLDQLISVNDRPRADYC